jgi:hypothetical protein
MLRQFIVYGSFGAVCVEDDSMNGAIQQVLLSFDYPEYERVSCVKEVFICGYPY